MASLETPPSRNFHEFIHPETPFFVVGERISAGLKLADFSCLSFLSAGIIGVLQHKTPKFKIFNFFFFGSIGV
jgi:hypothetical protein